MNALIGAVLGILAAVAGFAVVSLLVACMDRIGKRFGADAAGLFAILVVFAAVGAAAGAVIGAK